MSVNAISQASGADLLNLYSQSVGQGGATTPVDATAALLKTALAEAQMSEAELLGGSVVGSQLDVYG